MPSYADVMGVRVVLQVLLSDEHVHSMETGQLFGNVLRTLNKRHHHEDHDVSLQDGSSAAVCRFNWHLLVDALRVYGVPVDSDTMDLVLAGGTVAGAVCAVASAAHVDG